jgi:acetyl-CoA carboxylase biotin carboxylase subunit
MFSRILIANRGEIALRVLRACKELGIETVCVYSEADRGQTYLRFADQTICIGPAPPAESYLRADRIIAAAEITNVEAIHPGYGFLAENARFADQCRDSKIEFVGPSAESMRRLGDKVEARKIARKAKVATVPGSEGAIEDDNDAIELAEKIGYPVIIKAVAGGGGRGMRIVHNTASLRSALGQARNEAENAFKDPSIYLEKFIERPRHVEVQVLGDRDGHLVHLYERDCSLQRRYQKLVEESPSPHISPKTREELCKAALRLAREAGYYSAGTVEFLVDRKENFYFMEVNARIQVEHPVTEMTTGIDLVKWQIRIAAGEELGFKQREVKPRGSAIECRINAEDPENDFRPCPGTVEEYFAAGGVGVRVDSHVTQGTVISPRYDSLIGKLIVHRPTRAEAIETMRRCLSEFIVEPLKTTIPFHAQVCNHPDFAKGRVDTGFIERNW